MATTSPDNIWTPDGTDDYDHTIDLATMADSVQAAVSSVRTGANAFKGLLAARPTAGVEGRTYYATDINRGFRDDGTSWLPEHIFGVAVRTGTALAFSSGAYVRADGNTYWTTSSGMGAAQGVTYNNGWVITTPGWYEVSYHFVSGTAWFAGIQINAVNVASFTDLRAPSAAPLTPAGVAAGSGTGIIKLAANDVVQLWTLGIGGATAIAASSGGQQFAIKFIEAA